MSTSDESAHPTSADLPDSSGGPHEAKAWFDEPRFYGKEPIAMTPADIHNIETADEASFEDLTDAAAVPPLDEIDPDDLGARAG